MAETTYFCTNCKKLLVCKYTQKVIDFDKTIKDFNDLNSSVPIRLSITSNNYNCRHKELLVP